MSECPACGRPVAANACEACHRSPSGSQANRVLDALGVGKGGPGRRRRKRVYGQPTFQITVRLDREELDALKALSAADGNATASLVVAGLLLAAAKQLRPPREGITDAKRALIRELSQPGSDRQKVASRLRPVAPSNYGTPHETAGLLR